MSSGPSVASGAEDLLRLVHEIGRDAATIVLFVHPPQTLVFESSDHAALSHGKAKRYAIQE